MLIHSHYFACKMQDMLQKSLPTFAMVSCGNTGEATLMQYILLACAS